MEEKPRTTFAEPLFHPSGNRAKPFLKWAGGKSQLLPLLREMYPAGLKTGKINTYFEPFLGSGAVFFDVVQTYPIEAVCLCDVNDELVITYKTLQARAPDLVEELHRIQQHYFSLPAESQTRFFYAQRETFNKNRPGFGYETPTDAWIFRAAQFIFLNKTCFNGLYRVNAKGDYNTPMGSYKNPTICDADNLLAVARVLQKAEIRQADFRQVLPGANHASFVYFDPPYRPISATSSFKAYSQTNFSDREQTELAALFAQLDRQGAALLLSNSDPKNHDPNDDFFDKLYDNFHLHRVRAKRMINSVAEKRGTVSEIVVTNYRTE